MNDLVSKSSRQSAVSVKLRSPTIGLRSFTETADCLDDFETMNDQAVINISRRNDRCVPFPIKVGKICQFDVKSLCKVLSKVYVKYRYMSKTGAKYEQTAYPSTKST